MKYTGIFLGVLFLCAALGTHAAPAAAPAAGFEASFVQTRSLPGFDKPLVSHGRLRFDPGRGFRWEITAPYHYVFEMNGRTAQEQLPDGSVRHLDPDQTPWLAAVEHVFVSALSGDRAELQRYFEVGIATLDHGRRITLTPKPGPMAEAIVRIQVTESAPGQPERLEIRETSGGRMDIRFTPITRSAAAP